MFGGTMKKILAIIFALSLSVAFTGPATAVISDLTIKVVDSEGKAMPYGEIYWTTPNNQYHAVRESYLNNHGSVDLKGVINQEIRVEGRWIDRDRMIHINAIWVIENDGTDIELEIMEFPEVTDYEVFVTMPNGQPVANAFAFLKFSSDSSQGLSDFSHFQTILDDRSITVASLCLEYGSDWESCQGARGFSRGSNQDEDYVEYLSETDAQGRTVFSGFANAFENQEIQKTLRASFSDDVLHQETNPSEFLSDGENTLQLDYMPWFETKDQEISGTYGKLVPIEVQLNESNSQVLSNRDYSGYSVRISPPAGAKNKACTSKPKLNATTNASGIAKFKVCASKSGKYQVTSPGVVSSASINLKVKGAPPGRPSVSSYETPAKKTIELSVIAPAYTGGAKITKYKFVVYGSEKGGSKQFTKTFFVKNPKNVQKVRLTGINSYGPSSVKVYAITKNGTGDYVEVWPTLW